MSRSRTTIAFDVSRHGFDHLAPVAPIIQILAQDADLRVVARSALPG